MTEHELAHLRVGTDEEAALARRIEEAMAEARYQRDQELLNALENVPIGVDLLPDDAMQESFDNLMLDLGNAIEDRDIEHVESIKGRLGKLWDTLLERQATAEAALESFTNQLEH